MDFFWVVEPCSLVEVSQRFRDPCCLHHQGERPDDGAAETLVNFYQTTRRNNPEDSHLLEEVHFCSFQLRDKPLQAQCKLLS
jgi:hypothetical protein